MDILTSLSYSHTFTISYSCLVSPPLHSNCHKISKHVWHIEYLSVLKSFYSCIFKHFFVIIYVFFCYFKKINNYKTKQFCLKCRITISDEKILRLKYLFYKRVYWITSLLLPLDPIAKLNRTWFLEKRSYES